MVSDRPAVPPGAAGRLGGRGGPRRGRAARHLTDAPAPGDAKALARAADAALLRGAHAEGEALLRRAVALAPDDSAILLAHGNALWALQSREAALARFAEAAARRPAEPGILLHLARAHLAAGLAGPGEAALRALLAATPDHPPALAMLGGLLLGTHRLEEARPVLEAAHAGSPGNVATRSNLCFARLAQGDWTDGWPLLETRWRLARPPAGLSAPDAPLDLAAVAGRRVLLWGEQGLGDTLQFARYAPLVAASGAQVVLAVQPALRRLLARLPGIAAAVDIGGPLPAHDLHAPLMSLPWAFATTPATVPMYIPPLAPPRSLVDPWRRRLAGVAGLKVGLVWRGNPAQADNAARSVPAAALRPLLDLPGVRFVALQVPLPAADAAVLPGLADWTGGLDDLQETAALIAALDVVVAVDTAVAHLAGAMGRPVRLMLWAGACWRWLRGRDDTPWYPSMRLFRQQRPGDWAPVVAAVARSLAGSA